MKNTFYFSDKSLFLKKNTINFKTFEIDKIENVNIIDFFYKPYNIYLSILITLITILLIVQSFILILLTLILIYFIIYLSYSFKKKVLKFTYENEIFEFIINENDFFKLEELLKILDLHKYKNTKNNLFL